MGFDAAALTGLHAPGNSFGQDAAAYFRELVRTPLNFVQRGLHIHSLESLQADEALSGDPTEEKGELKREMGPFDLVNVGIGIILGAGIFVVTGTVANSYAGPASIISYAIAGFSAILTSVCYAEYGVDIPIAGGSFSYVMMTFGEFIAWFVVAALVLNYVLANAAVARSFSPYLAALCNKNDDLSFFLVNSGGYELDFLAFGLVLLLMLLLVWGIRETKSVNNMLTIAHVGLVLFIIIAGFTQAHASNWSPFAPQVDPTESNVRGIFNGASLVFFSYIGFDAIANVAEECRNPARDLPIGFLGSLGIVTVLYLLAVAALTLMLPYTEISPDAAFSVAFGAVGLKWVQYVVAVGALTGIVTGTLLGQLVVTRLAIAMGRAHLVPPIFAHLSPKLGTPVIATLLLGFATALIALFTSFDALIGVISICILFVYMMVAEGILFRHYYVKGKNSPLLALGFMFIITGASIGLSAYYQLSTGWVGLLVTGVIWLVATLAMQICCREQYHPNGFSTPLLPWLPAGSIILNVFLMGQMARSDYVKFGVFAAIAIFIYIIYGLPATTLRRQREDLVSSGGKADLAYAENGGRYGSNHGRPAMEMTGLPKV